MKTNKFDRRRAIAKLVDCSADEFNQGALCFDEIMMSGFVGYNNMDDYQLHDELKARDINPNTLEPK